MNIEAMACGFPLVATRVGGIPEIAAEGGVLLVEPNSAVELAGALQRLIEDKNLRGKVAAEGLESFQRRFTWTPICRQYQEIVDRLCAKRAARGNGKCKLLLFILGFCRGPFHGFTPEKENGHSG